MQFRLAPTPAADADGIPPQAVRSVSDIELGFKLPNLLTVIRLAIAQECKVVDLTSVFDKTDRSSFLP